MTARPLTVLGVFVAFTIACGRMSEPPPHASTAVQVEQIEVENEITSTGTIQPAVGAQVDVGPRISGVLEKLFVRVGEKVEKGQLLAELDHEMLDLAVRQAESSLEEARVEEKLLRDQAARRRSLAAKGLITAEELEEASTSAELAHTRVARLEVDRDAAVVNRTFAQIHAPIAGTVIGVATQEGETVAASFAVPTFVTIVDLERLQVEAYVDEIDIGRVANGQSVQFTVDAYPGEEFSGELRAVVPKAVVRDNLVYYTVVIEIASGDLTKLRPQMTASVNIKTGDSSQALVLPVEAIRTDVDGQTYVLVAPGGGRRDVFVGEQLGRLARIRGGVNMGEEVLVDGPKGDGS